MKLKISIALNVVLFALAAFLVVRNELREIEKAVVAGYFPEKKPDVFDTAGIRLPPERFAYRLHENSFRFEVRQK